MYGVKYWTAILTFRAMQPHRKVCAPASRRRVDRKPYLTVNWNQTWKSTTILVGYYQGVSDVREREIDIYIHTRPRALVDIEVRDWTLEIPRIGQTISSKRAKLGKLIMNSVDLLNICFTVN